MIENSKYHTEHQVTVEAIKSRLQAQGWIVAYLDSSTIELFFREGTNPDLIAVTPENVLVFVEYKKKCWEDYFEYYEPSRFVAYRQIVDDTGIPLILAVRDGNSELMLP